MMTLSPETQTLTAQATHDLTKGKLICKQADERQSLKQHAKI
jgi:hypothetical protein